MSKGAGGLKIQQKGNQKAKNSAETAGVTVTERSAT